MNNIDFMGFHARTQHFISVIIPGKRIYLVIRISCGCGVVFLENICSRVCLPKKVVPGHQIPGWCSYHLNLMCVTLSGSQKDVVEIQRKVQRVPEGRRGDTTEKINAKEKGNAKEQETNLVPRVKGTLKLYVKTSWPWYRRIRLFAIWLAT